MNNIMYDEPRQKPLKMISMLISPKAGYVKQ